MFLLTSRDKFPFYQHRVPMKIDLQILTMSLCTETIINTVYKLSMAFEYCRIIGCRYETIIEDFWVDIPG